MSLLEDEPAFPLSFIPVPFLVLAWWLWEEMYLATL